MKYEIKPSSDRQYIILTVKGEINRNTAMQQNIEAHKLGAKLNINRYLVDVTEARNTDTAIDSHQFAYKDMRNSEDVDMTARVALLVSPGDHSHNFIETVAKNAGLNVTIFTDLEVAEAYLGEEVT